MSFNIKNHKEELLFLPIGGSNEIGMNVNLYHFQGKWIIIDCGSGFPDDYYPGVDIIVADINFVIEHRQNILAIILTHAHEDHLGGVGFLLQEIDCPIYTTSFTANFLKSKLLDFRLPKKPEIIEVKTKSIINLDPFQIELVALTHSAPEMHALMIRTSAGNVFHTGDWKFDHDPVIGESNDEELLQKIGDEGVTALVCDSTNVFNKNLSGSEGDLRKSLVDIIGSCKKLVVVTTFASNVARLDTIIHAAKIASRRVALSGRSMHRILAAAQDSGYLVDVPHLIDERSISRYKREELVIIATGCQGEPLAATAKMASKNHQHFRLTPGDTVIFSSKVIPGNEKKIFRMTNMLIKEGIEVITEREHFVHVSGHPSVEELKKMFDLIRPKIVIPVHGEPAHIHEHAKLVKKWGNAHVIEIENGIVAKLDPYEPQIVGKVHTGYLAVDGNFLLAPDSNILKMRRRIRDTGIILVVVTVNSKGDLLASPTIFTPGSLDEIEDQDAIENIKSEIKNLLKELPNNKKITSNNDEEVNVIKSLVKRMVKEENGKTPQILIEVVRI